MTKIALACLCAALLMSGSGCKKAQPKAEDGKAVNKANASEDQAGKELQRRLDEALKK